MTRTAIDDIYERMVGDEDARVCRDIDESACRVVPGNFFRQLAAFTLTKLGDRLISPKTTLTWVFAAVTAPVWMVGWLVPIRESGSLLPQLLIAAYVRRRPVRKWVWVTGGVLQALSVGWLAWSTWAFQGAEAGYSLLMGLTIFSLSRGLCSVASKDVSGKTVPKTRRGRLSGFAASTAGLVAIGVAGGLWWGFDSREPAVLAGLLALAALLWLGASLVYGSIREFPGATEGGGNAIVEAFARLGLLRDDRAFRNFVIARGLLLVSALTGPYLVLLAREHAQDGLGALPLFIIAAGLATLLSGPLWGRFADTSSRRTMIFAALLASAVALAAVGLDGVLPPSAWGAWSFVGLFFLLSVAHAGVRLGRQTYVVDLAGGNRRTDYVAVSNTAMGAILLVTGAITGLLSTVSVPLVLIVLAAMGIAGALVSRQLPEVE